MRTHFYYNSVSGNHLDISTWVAIAAALAAIAAAVATFWQAKGLQLSIKAETLLKFLERFDSKEFGAIRKTATLACHTNIKNKNPGIDVDDLLDFFEDIAFMVKKKALDEEMVWHGFYHWMRLYYLASEEYIKERRQEEPVVWLNFINLLPALNNLERKNSLGKFKEKLDDAELYKQLLDEASAFIN